MLGALVEGRGLAALCSFSLRVSNGGKTGTLVERSGSLGLVLEVLLINWWVIANECSKIRD